ncbi:MAG: dipeptidase [Ktedonobacteraceae bacterium]
MQNNPAGVVNRLPIFDGHNDVLLHLHSPERGAGCSFFVESEKGHLDLPRMRKGGFGGGFFAVYVPPEPGPTVPKDEVIIKTTNGYEFPLAPALSYEYALKTALAITARLFRLEAESEGQVKVVRNADELETSLHSGVLAAILHFEGAEAIDPNLDALEVLYQAGLRSLGIVWSRPNIFGHGVPFKFPHSPDTGPGLTNLGKHLVRACNRLGIMVDLSHITEQGFWDVENLSDKPLVATHSNVYALCPCPRNLTDKQLDAIKASEGMVGLNFAVSFLREDGHNNASTPIDVMVRHIDYLVERLGIEHVGFGSDFDGATVPQEIKDVTGLPKLITALREHGYDDTALHKLAYENWVQVLRKTWHA